MKTLTKTKPIPLVSVLGDSLISRDFYVSWDRIQDISVCDEPNRHVVCESSRRFEKGKFMAVLRWTDLKESLSDNDKEPNKRDVENKECSVTRVSVRVIRREGSVYPYANILVDISNHDKVIVILDTSGLTAHITECDEENWFEDILKIFIYIKQELNKFLKEGGSFTRPASQ